MLSGQAQITAASGFPTKGLRAWYPLNGDTLDHSGNGFHATPTDITYQDGLVGLQAASLDAANPSLIKLPDIDNQYFNQRQLNATMVVFVNRDAIGQTESILSLMFSSLPGGYFGWEIRAEVDGTFLMWLNRSGILASLLYTPSKTPGDWYCLGMTLTYNTQAKRIDFIGYVDGLPIGSETFDANIGAPYPDTINVGLKNVVNDFGFTGLLQDVLLYNHPLPASLMKGISGLRIR